MNVEQQRNWWLHPGSERDAVGGALRRALAVRADRLPIELSGLLNQLAHRPNHEEVKVPRELIDTGTDKRFVRRDHEGEFEESDDVGRSSAQDQKWDSKTRPQKGEGDKGDR